jgi:hypothetical protein
MATLRCEINLVLEYAYWTYPSIRDLIEDTCEAAGEFHARLARGCTGGDERLVSVHDYQLCPEHAALLPVLDDAVLRTGDEPRLVGEYV